MNEPKGISIFRLQKSFGEKKVLQDVSFFLEEGGVYCLMAPSGAGKTTLLHILMGLMKGDGGEIRGLEGKTFSAVFQENRLLEWENAVENVRLVCHNKDENKIKALLSELLPGEDLRKPVAKYSGGMKRRVALARAVAAPSRILILDEPFSGLDPDTKARAAKFLLRHRDKRTVLTVTHQEEDAALLGASILKL